MIEKLLSFMKFNVDGLPRSDLLKESLSLIVEYIFFLKCSLYYLEIRENILMSTYFDTARVSFNNLRGALTYFTQRFDYVMMYPHRIILDRTVLETGLKKYGMDRVVQYLISSHYIIPLPARLPIGRVELIMT